MAQLFSCFLLLKEENVWLVIQISDYESCCIRIDREKLLHVSCFDDDVYTLDYDTNYVVYHFNI